MEEEKVLTPELEEGEVVETEKEESIADSVRIVSPGQLVMKRFFRSKLSVIGLVTLIVLFLFSFIGPLFSPWGEIQTDNSIPKEKRETYISASYNERIDPSEIYKNGVNGEMKDEIAANFNTNTKVGWYIPDDITIPDGANEMDYRIYFIRRNNNSDIYRCDAQGNILYSKYVEYSWDHKTFNQLGKIDANHWLGTDEQGMDVFVRLMYGGRISLTLGFVVVFLETFLGIIFGGLAGYFGKWVDQVIMRIVDIFNCVPTFPILLILSAVLDGMEIPQNLRIYYLMIIMTLLGWSGIARVVRGQILFLREQEYMIAAEALGLSVPRKIFRHLLPNILPQLIVQMTLGLGSIILTESTLSYLGIGIPIPYAAWGTMISSAQKPEILQNYPNLWIPAGILIVLAVLAFNFIGDGLRDAFDPKASR